MTSRIVAERQVAPSASLPPVTGRTRIYGILADPIYHVKTPEVMNALFNLDQVAYVRYASVYKDFREASDFNEFVGTLKPEVS